MDMPKRYEPGPVEERWREFWPRSGFFTPTGEPGRHPFCIVIPPPNITGRLHIGHALDNTLQDILVRWRRMQGLDVLWLPGTDHAGIATQMVVERELARQGIDRHRLGREGFVERVWKWKEEHGGAIVDQLRRLGASCDWTRLRFTLEPALSRAVTEAFVRLHREGLVYRGKAIVQWCPSCRTALSDLEVAHRETTGKLTTLAYPLKGSRETIPVATTRPETMLGDTAVAVHPSDERYSRWVGRAVVLPVLGREIPILADESVDLSFGSGAVKVTPAHDPADFAIATRHGLPAIRVIDGSGRMTGEAGPYAGLDRFECRRRLVADLTAAGVITATRDHVHAVGRCDRCDTIVEPFLSDQWFVRTAPLAAQALRAVEEGRIRFVPENRVNDYFEWMRNIHDWCISRQLWWGHRIPAWTCPACSGIVVDTRAPAACPSCGKGSLEQDPDVLDTWFSSSLWPFSTLGWPEASSDLARYYPTSVLVTGYDILFFWVARMAMMGLKLMGEVPFRQVCFHGLIRDEKGRKMSKTRGNTVDPLDLMDRFGTDALRFSLAAMASPGSDIPLDLKRIEGYQAFANKLWNASRFVLMNLGDGARGPSAVPQERAAPAPLTDRWIRSRVSRLEREVNASLEGFRFDEAAMSLYHFLWHEFCDWYIEAVKPHLVETGTGSGAGARSRAVLADVLDRVLRLLHPFMPFLTEEIWQRLPHEGPSIAVAEYPRGRAAEEDPEAEREMDFLMSVVSKTRNIRAEGGLDPSRRLALWVKVDSNPLQRLLEEHERLVRSLAQLSELRVVPEFPSGAPAARGVLPGAELAIPLASALDRDEERRRLAREMGRIEKELEVTTRKLENSSFVDRAPSEIVEKVRSAHRDLLDRRERVARSLERLDAPGPSTAT
jgi:valyl-tRNA synthetase